MSPLPKKFNPSRNNINPPEISQPPPPIISQPSTRKFLNPSQKFLNPARKFLNPSRKFLNPPEKISTPLEKISTPKYVNRHPYPPPPNISFFLFLSISFPSLFKKNSKFRGGGLNSLNPPPPLTYALVCKNSSDCLHIMILTFPSPKKKLNIFLKYHNHIISRL